MPRARKRHWCCECRGNIQPGEVYERFSGIWEDPDTFKTCADCIELRKELDTLVDFQCPYGGIHEFICDLDDPYFRTMSDKYHAIRTKRAPKPPPAKEEKE